MTRSWCRVVVALLVAATSALGTTAPSAADPPDAPVGRRGVPTTTITGAVEAVLDADGSGWLIRASDPAYSQVHLWRRYADGREVQHGRVFTRDAFEAGPCQARRLEGTASTPVLVGDGHVCAVRPDGSWTVHPLPAGTWTDQVVVDVDGIAWFAGRGATELGRLGPGGTSTVPVPGTGNVAAVGIGPDGRARVARGATVYALTAGGTTTPVAALSRVNRLATGPDGRLWALARCSDPCDARLVAIGADGRVATIVEGAPDTAPAMAAAGGRLWMFDGSSLVGVDPAGRVRRFPFGLLAGRCEAIPSGTTSDVLVGSATTLVVRQGSTIERFAPGTPPVTVTGTATADPAVDGGWLVTVSARGESGAALSGTADVYRPSSSPGTLGCSGYAQTASGAVTPAQPVVTVAPAAYGLCGVLLQDPPYAVGFAATTGGGAEGRLTIVGPVPQGLEATDAAFRAAVGRAPDPDARWFWARPWLTSADSPALATALLRTREAEVRVVRAVYAHTFGWAPDAGGLEYWRGQLRPRGRRAVTAAIVGSAEAFARSGGTRSLWVAWAYPRLVGHAPTAAEMDAALARLGAGATRAVVASEVLATPAGVAARVARTATEVDATALVTPEDTSSFTTDEVLRRDLVARRATAARCGDAP